MNKNVIILNGSGGTGKGEFVKALKKHRRVLVISSVDEIKKVAEMLGWDGGKTEKDRKLLSDLLLMSTAYNDRPFKYICEYIDYFLYHTDNFDILSIDIRDIFQIKKVVDNFYVTTILMRNGRVQPIVSNEADANVENYDYDYILENNGTLEDLEFEAVKFVYKLENNELINYELFKVIYE